MWGYLLWYIDTDVQSIKNLRELLIRFPNTYIHSVQYYLRIIFKLVLSASNGEKKN